MTTPEQWPKIKEIVGAALECEPGKRETYLDQACSRDRELRAEVESLLAAYDNADELSQHPLAAQVADSPSQFTNIGSYRLIRELGVGGMGEVWLAEQTEPVRRQVAVKLIRAGMYDSSAVQRFRMERQSLAVMDHPSIAKVFDAGATPFGQPYLVMEYVEGSSITDYCDRKKLGIRERLTLFLQVCAGVQHAHQKAIIHRDLKPSNILIVEVDGKPTPRIIDFGLAKATSPTASGESLHTQVGSFMGTPGYMSPEQLDPDIHDIDTRTDVYSLGVVLYELLTGFLPFETKDWKQRRLDEVLRELRETDPQSPSTKVSTNRDTSTSKAEARAMQPAQLASLLQGDLDWIALKALEKDRERRYRTPDQLAADIENYLCSRPVVAGPTSSAYRLRKYLQRHAAAVAVVSIVILTLATGVGVATWQARRAQRRFDQVRHLANVFLFDFEQSIHNVPGATKARQLLVKTALEYLDSLSRDAAGDAELTRELAAAFEKVGDIQGDPGSGNVGNSTDALHSYERAMSLRSGLGDKESRDPAIRLAFVEVLDKIAVLQLRTGNVDGAMQSAQQAVSLAEYVVQAGHSNRAATTQLASAYINLANAEVRGSSSQLASGHCQKAIDLLEPLDAASAGDRDIQNRLATAYWRMGLVFVQLNSFEKAIPYLGKALPLLEKLLAGDPNDAVVRRQLMIVLSQLSISSTYSHSPDYKLNVERSRRSVAIAEQAVATDPANVEAVSDLVAVAASAAAVFREGARYADAKHVFERAISAGNSLVERDPGSKQNQLSLAVTRVNFGSELTESGDFPAAMEEFRLADQIYGNLLQQSPGDLRVLSSRVFGWIGMGKCLSKQRKWQEARRYYSIGLEVAEKYAPQQTMFAMARDQLREADQRAARASAKQRQP